MQTSRAWVPAGSTCSVTYNLLVASLARYARIEGPHPLKVFPA